MSFSPVTYNEAGEFSICKISASTKPLHLLDPAEEKVSRMLNTVPPRFLTVYRIIALNLWDDDHELIKLPPLAFFG